MSIHELPLLSKIPTIQLIETSLAHTSISSADEAKVQAVSFMKSQW